MYSQNIFSLVFSIIKFGKISSRLASIFGLSTNQAPSISVLQPQTLPIKVPDRQNNAAQESKTEVIIAKAVHAFKL